MATTRTRRGVYGCGYQVGDRVSYQGVEYEVADDDEVGLWSLEVYLRLKRVTPLGVFTECARSDDPELVLLS